MFPIPRRQNAFHAVNVRRLIRHIFQQVYDRATSFNVARRGIRIGYLSHQRESPLESCGDKLTQATRGNDTKFINQLRRNHFSSTEPSNYYYLCLLSCEIGASNG